VVKSSKKGEDYKICNFPYAARMAKQEWLPRINKEERTGNI